MSIDEKIIRAKKDYENVYDAGKKAEYDKFWDACQNYGNRTNYTYGVCGYTFNADNFYPKYDIRPSNASRMFYSWRDTGGIPHQIGFNLAERLKECNVVLDTSQPCILELTFAYSDFGELPAIDMTNATNLTGTFNACNVLKKIEKIISGENTPFVSSSTFKSCGALQDVVFEGVIGQNGLNLQWSTRLTHDSLMSVINCLQDKTSDTSGTTWIVTLGTTNMAKLTVDELAIAKNKGWTVQ